MIQFLASMLTAWLRRLLGRSQPATSETTDPPADTNGGGGPGPRPKG